MRLIGFLLLVLAAASFILPPLRPMLPFRIPVEDWDATNGALVMAIAGVVALLADRVR